MPSFMPNNVFIAGAFSGTSTVGGFPLTAAGTFDLFVRKLGAGSF